MTEAAAARVRWAFERALEAPEGEREGVVAAECGGDREVEREVRSLLAARGRAGEFLKTPVMVELIGAPGAAALVTPAALAGARLGRYTLARLIGEGGMGAVYEAEQENPRRTVAVKVIASPLASATQLRRFEREAQILGRLRHPALAQVHEAGVQPVEMQGGGSTMAIPFIAMEYVPGARRVTEFAREHGFGVREIVELFVRVCEGVQHGHEHGVIHRDLKPGNILVDGEGAPKVIDFGVARAAGSDLGLGTLGTERGQILGTPAYMSPEQFSGTAGVMGVGGERAPVAESVGTDGRTPAPGSGEADRIDARTDVYSLGVVLYELLTGRSPYDVGTDSPFDVARAIRESPARRPSSVDRRLRGDLETIVLKTLEKERDRRYASAGELADDLGRFLRHEPIRARPPSAAYQFRKFARRNPGLVAGVGAAFLALSIGLGVAIWQAVQTRAALEESQRQAYIANIAAADGALRADDGGTAMARLEAAPAEYRGWEWRRLMWRADLSSATWGFPDSETLFVAVHPDGERVLISQAPGCVTLMRIPSGEVVWKRTGLSGFQRSFSRDGALVACQSEEDVVVCDGATGDELRRFRAFEEDEYSIHGLSVSFHPDGRLLAIGDRGNKIAVWDWRKGERLWMRKLDGWAGDAQFSPDGSALAFTDKGCVRLVAPATGTPICLALPGPAESERYLTGALCFSPDGLVLAASHGPVIRLWDVPTATLRDAVTPHAQRVQSLEFSADGRLLASASADRTARVWDVGAGRSMTPLVGHASEVRSAHFCCGGSRLVTVAEDRCVKLWDPPLPPPARVLATTPGLPISLRFLPGGLVYSHGGLVTVADPSSGADVLTIEPEGLTGDNFVASSPDGRLLARRGADDSLNLWDARTGSRVWVSSPFPDRILGVVFSADGTRVVCDDIRSVVSVLDTGTGALLLRFEPGAEIEELFAQPGSSAIAAAARDKSVRLWDVTTGALLKTITDVDAFSQAIAFNRDGSLLAAGTREGTVCIWETRSWRRIATLSGMRPWVCAVAFSPDGARLAAGSQDRAVHVWDTAFWRELLQLRGHEGTVNALAWSDDGRFLASGSYDFTVRIWDAPPR